MEIELIKAWVNMNAPDSIKDDLIKGAQMLKRDRRRMEARRDEFPNEGELFNEREVALIEGLEVELDNFMVYNWERDREIEQMFGRPLKSIKGKLRRIKAKRAVNE